MIELNIKYFFFNLFRERTALVWGNDLNAVIIDPSCITSDERSKLFSTIDEKKLSIKAILLTHGHFDHIYGVKACIERYGCTVYMNAADQIAKDGAKAHAADFGMPEPDTDWTYTTVSEGQVLDFGEMKFAVIETPGHSPGSVSYYCEESMDLFSGDCLFAGSIGNTSGRWGDYDKEIVSIMDKLMVLDPDVKVHPGHGGGTTIGYERTHNPFLEPFNEKDPETGAVDGILIDGEKQ